MSKLTLILKSSLFSLAVSVMPMSYAGSSAGTYPAKSNIDPVDPVDARSVNSVLDIDPAFNIVIDKKMNLHLSDGVERSAERCSKRKSETEFGVDGEVLKVCRAYEKRTRLLDSKTITILLNEGSYILTLIDENGSMYQICYNDDWIRVDCSEL